ncbi:MAG: Dph6-related ATP pyrophosphatase [Candidatus Methanodesulfokora washburnensis]|jgi:diphthine-ammonia ligase
MIPAVASWSGGKDSCLAYYKAIQSGFNVKYLVNFVGKDGRASGHGLRREVLALQAEALGVPIIQEVTTWETYEERFKDVMSRLKQKGINAAVFGDIWIPEHLEWVAKVCNEIGIAYVEPLWNHDTLELLKEFISLGFRAIVVSVRADLLSDDWLGREIDYKFIEDMIAINKTRNIDLCGERGEYHTLVIDGPIFRKRLRIVERNKIFGKDVNKWLFDIQRCELEDK